MLDRLITGALQGMGQPQGGSPLLQVLAALLSSGGGNGGLSGLIRQFQEAGLGEQIASWISTGQNLPVDSDQLMQAVGAGRMQQLAADAGLSAQDLSQQMSGLLPQLIDQLTPSGQVPADGLDDALGALSRLMPGRS